MPHMSFDDFRHQTGKGSPARGDGVEDPTAVLFLGFDGSFDGCNLAFDAPNATDEFFLLKMKVCHCTILYPHTVLSISVCGFLPIPRSWPRHRHSGRFSCSVQGSLLTNGNCLKTRASGMPEESYLQTFFDPIAILTTLGLNRISGPVVDVGAGYGTFTFAIAGVSGHTTLFRLRGIQMMCLHAPPASELAGKLQPRDPHGARLGA